jgi:hydrocephalus-inducing protein
MACESRLPCNFKLACSAPFRISHDEFKLIPDEKAIVIVYFDPGYKTDRKSGEQEGKLTITHF